MVFSSRTTCVTLCLSVLLPVGLWLSVSRTGPPSDVAANGRALESRSTSSNQVIVGHQSGHQRSRAGGKKNSALAPGTQKKYRQSARRRFRHQASLGRSLSVKGGQAAPSAAPRPISVPHDTGKLPRVISLSPHPVGDIFGLGTYIAQRDPNLTDPLIRATRSLGAGWVREEFTASRLHDDTDAPYLWTSFDRVIDRERKLGLNVLGLLDYSNTWNYQNNGVVPHRDVRQVSQDFAAYAYAVARHFRHQIRYWEVWNEPNLPIFWWPSPNPADYARLLTSAYHAIKRANPAAQVIMGATAGSDLNFIHAVAQRTNAFDAVSVHPYAVFPENHLLAQIQVLRKLGKPVWLSEAGWAGNGCPLCPGEAQQASRLVRLYTLAAAVGVERVFWYDLRDDPHVAINPEAHFGLLKRDLVRKRAALAYRFLARVLRQTRFVDADRLGQDGIYALRFRSPRGPMLVAWNMRPYRQSASLPWRPAGYALLSMRGAQKGASVRAHGWAKALLPAWGRPVYLVPAGSFGTGLVPRVVQKHQRAALRRAGRSARHQRPPHNRKPGRRVGASGKRHARGGTRHPGASRRPAPSSKPTPAVAPTADQTAVPSPSPGG